MRINIPCRVGKNKKAYRTVDKFCNIKGTRKKGLFQVVAANQLPYEGKDFKQLETCSYFY